MAWAGSPCGAVPWTCGCGCQRACTGRCGPTSWAPKIAGPHPSSRRPRSGIAGLLFAIDWSIPWQEGGAAQHGGQARRGPDHHRHRTHGPPPRPWGPALGAAPGGAAGAPSLSLPGRLRAGRLPLRPGGLRSEGVPGFRPPLAQGIGPRAQNLSAVADNIVLIGFMGAGKSTVGRRLAARLGRPFVDLDAVIEETAGMPIPAIFAREGEAGFREREAAAVRAVAQRKGQVIATGGGAVMRRDNLAALRAAGTLVWLRAPLETLLERAKAEGRRPLLAAGEAAAARLYDERLPVYALADGVVDATDDPDAVAAQIEQRLAGVPDEGPTVVSVPVGAAAYPVYVGAGLVRRLGQLLADRGVTGRCLVATNPTVGGYYGERLMQSLAAAGFAARRVDIPDGEAHKNLATAEQIYRAALAARLERRDFFVALGGGVVGDVAGFAAATYLRGVALVQAPTTLLAQVDASVGGKVGVNLAEGKNLVGAFHQPRLVAAD